MGNFSKIKSCETPILLISASDIFSMLLSTNIISILSDFGIDENNFGRKCKEFLCGIIIEKSLSYDISILFILSLTNYFVFVY